MSTNWPPKRLDELGLVARGKSRHRPRNDPSLYGGEYPFFQTGDIKAANLYLRQHEQTYNDKGLAQSRLWPVGTLCITIAANIAESAFLAVEGCFPDSVVGFIADPKKSDAKFVKYSLDVMKTRMQSISRGTTQDNLSVEKLLSFRFPKPLLDIQHRIAGILSSYDDLIEVNTHRIAILEEMARRLFEEWIGKVDAEAPPRGWRKACLADLVAERRDSVLPPEISPYTPYVGLEHMPRRSITLTEWGRADEVVSTKLRFSLADILFGKIRPYFHKVVVAPVDGVSSSDAIVMRPNSVEAKAIAVCLTSSDPFVARAVQTSNGTKMPRANWSVLKKFEFAFPPPDILERFVGIVEPAIEFGARLAAANRNLRAARDLLLPKLISGEIDLERAGREFEPVQEAAE